MAANPKHILSPKDGAVQGTAQPDVTEKEIVEDRQLIIQRLDAAYLNLTDRLAPFQKEWDADPVQALLESALQGAGAGASEWGDDFADMFKADTWKDVGKSVEKMAGTAYDAAKGYSVSVYNGIADSTAKAAREVQDTVAHADKTLLNWAWWQRKFDEASTEARKAAEQRAHEHVQAARATAAVIEKGKLLYKHREAIFNLPNLIVKGDPKPVQAFVDTVLMEIDPELARQIRSDPKFGLALELIADHESILSYMAYVGLLMEAIPPNFFAYLAAKGGVYLLIELVLLLVTAVLSAGAAAAARVASLLARLATSGARIGKAVKKVERAMDALNAFVRVIEDFYLAATGDFRALADKLRRARQRGLVLKGSTKSTITAKKQAMKREPKCSICHSTQHTSPRHRLGVIVYK